MAQQRLFSAVALTMAGLCLAGAAQGALLHDVTSASFDTDVRDSSVDTLVLLYDPTCGNCIAVLPEVESLAMQLQSAADASVRVAVMDVTKYHVPGDLHFDDVPAVFFFAASGNGASGSDSGVGFGGRRKRGPGRAPVRDTAVRTNAAAPVLYDGDDLDAGSLLRFLHKVARNPTALPVAPAPRATVSASSSVANMGRKWTTAAGFDAVHLFGAIRNELRLLEEQIDSLESENAMLKQSLAAARDGCGGHGVPLSQQLSAAAATAAATATPLSPPLPAAVLAAPVPSGPAEPPIGSHVDENENPFAEGEAPEIATKSGRGGW